MRLKALLWVAVLFIAGCASPPPLPKIGAAAGDRVGIWVESGTTPLHEHVGTTIFNNFSKRYSYPWNLGPEVERTVGQAIRAAGLEAVDLRAEGLGSADVAGLIQPTGESWRIVPGKEEAVRRLKDRHRLKALIVVKEERVLAALECNSGGCNERYADASGLYTRGIFGLTRYTAVAAFRWNVFVLDPVADVAQAAPLRSVLQIPGTPLADFQDPADFKNLTEAEFAPVRAAVMRFVATVSAEAVKALGSR